MSPARPAALPVLSPLPQDSFQRRRDGGEALPPWQPEPLFGAGKKKDRQQKALKDSEIPLLKKRIHQQLGITGRGVTVGIVEEIGEYVKRRKPKEAHATHVGSVLTGRRWGVAPGAERFFYYSPHLVPKSPQDEPESFHRYLIREGVLSLKPVIQLLNKIASEQANPPRVLNFSFGIDQVSQALNLAETLEEDAYTDYESEEDDAAASRDVAAAGRKTAGRDTFPEDEEDYKYPFMRWFIYGKNPGQLTKAQKFLKALEFVHNVHQTDKKTNGPMQKTLKRYQNVTRRLAEQGVVIVVAAGNEHDEFPRHRVTPADEVNFFSMSDHVISVAASDTRGTPGNRRDDRIANFSSRGWVDLAAPGVDVVVSDPKAKRLKAVNGTSFSAPYVAGTVALILEANPDLTFKQIKTILIDTAERPRHYKPTIAGAGFVRPERAVLKALEMRWQD